MFILTSKGWKRFSQFLHTRLRMAQLKWQNFLHDNAPQTKNDGILILTSRIGLSLSTEDSKVTLIDIIQDKRNVLYVSRFCFTRIVFTCNELIKICLTHWPLLRIEFEVAERIFSWLLIVATLQSRALWSIIRVIIPRLHLEKICF